MRAAPQEIEWQWDASVNCYWTGEEENGAMVGLWPDGWYGLITHPNIPQGWVKTGPFEEWKGAQQKTSEELLQWRNMSGAV
jgi:hypothetical protein